MTLSKTQNALTSEMKMKKKKTREEEAMERLTTVKSLDFNWLASGFYKILSHT